MNKKLLKYLPISIIIALLINLIILTFIPVERAINLVPISLIGILIIKNIAYELEKRNTKNIYLYINISLLLSFYVAPIIHTISDEHTLYYINDVPENLNEYYFYISTLYLVSYISFKLIRPGRNNIKNTNYWIFPKKNLWVIYSMMIASFISQTFLYIKFGGVNGYVSRASAIDGSEGFAGYGSFFLISELFPILSILAFFIYYSRGNQKTSGLTILIFLCFLFFSCVYFGGLRGSRSNTIFTILHATILIHIFFRKFSKKEIFIFCAFVGMFMFIGKIYKRNKEEGFQMITKFEFHDSGEKKQDFTSIIMGDFARYDIQAYLLYKLKENSNYTPKLGLTYIGDILKFIPFTKKIIESKVEAGSELMYGHEFLNQSRKASRIYGLLGESLLNFYIYLIPFSFLILSAVVKRISRFFERLNSRDIRWFFFPLAINALVISINSDLDNILFFLSKRVIIIFIIIILFKLKINLNPKTNT